MVPSHVMIGLGIFRFGMSGAAYESLSRRMNYRWSAQNRIGRRPAMQYTGPGVEEITIEGVIYPHYRGGLRQTELMRLRAGTGYPMMLVDGLGFIWERWVVVSIDETKSVFLPGGAPQKIEFSLTLRAYGRDQA